MGEVVAMLAHTTLAIALSIGTRRRLPHPSWRRASTANRSPCFIETVRVLIISAWDPTSGVLTVYRSLARHLAPKGVRFSAYAFDGWRPDTLWKDFCEDLIDGRQVTLAEVLMTDD